MVEINKFSKNLFKKAEAFEIFRNECKAYLEYVNMNFDKFTVVGHDSYVGYISENIIADYLVDSFKNIKVTTWEKNHNIRNILNIIKEKDYSLDSKLAVKNYFYDTWDLKITIGDNIVYCDVKTALTAKSPNSNWNFMYPVIQANKDGKDIMLLAYYVVENTKYIESLKKIVVVGVINPTTIKKCKIIKKGETTKFGTISQIDNYLTQLSKHYQPIEYYIK